MKKNRLVILGGNGFIGQNLSSHFADNGAEVFSFDIALPKFRDERVRYIVGDFFDTEQLKNAVEGANTVIHAISTVNPGNSNEKYMQGYEKDLLQTVRLCTMLSQTDTKMLFLSSGGTVYGDQSRQPIAETALPSPLNHYGTLKLCIENIIRTFNTQSGTNFKIARIANPYGPGQDYTRGVGFIDAVLKRAMNGKPVEIWGDGETVRDYIYITDVCKMIYSLYLYDGRECTFNISSGHGISQNEILGIIKNLGLNVSAIYEPARSVDVKKIVLDNSKIRSFYTGGVTSAASGIKKYYEYLTGERK